MASSARGSGTKVSTCSTKAPTSTRSAPRCDFHDIDRACRAVHRAEDVARRLGRAEHGRAPYLFRARAVRGGAAGVALARPMAGRAARGAGNGGGRPVEIGRAACREMVCVYV